jgi:hypothetical protein
VRELPGSLLLLEGVPSGSLASAESRLQAARGGEGLQEIVNSLFLRGHINGISVAKLTVLGRNVFKGICDRVSSLRKKVKQKSVFCPSHLYFPTCPSLLALLSYVYSPLSHCFFAILLLAHIFVNSNTTKAKKTK